MTHDLSKDINHWGQEEWVGAIVVLAIHRSFIQRQLEDLNTLVDAFMQVDERIKPIVEQSLAQAHAAKLTVDPNFALDLLIRIKTYNNFLATTPGALAEHGS